MEQRRPHPDATDAQSDGGDAHVFDRRVGEEAFVVVRSAQEQGTDDERQYAGQQQHVLHPREDGRDGQQLVDAEYGQESCIDQPRRDEGRPGRGSREVGVDPYGVERENFRFAAIPAKYQ